MSCSEKPRPDAEKLSATPEAKREAAGESESEDQPHEDKIAEDCVAFVRATKAVSVQPSPADCPGCAAEGREALTFRQMRTERISCAAESCTVLVSIRAVFNPGAGEGLAGGLTAWISPEDRSAFLSSQPPDDEQTYRVLVTYQRRGEAWRAVEFDRAPAD